MTQVVLVPHDLSDFSDAGLDGASRMAPVNPGAGGQLHLVHVLPRIDRSLPGLVWPADEDEARLEHARTALQVRLKGTAYEHAILHLRIGDPGARIVAVAKEIGANLVVMPSHGRTGLQRLLLGSVAEHVARFAPCPVLILPSHVTGTLEHRVCPLPPKDTSREGQVDAIGAAIVDRCGSTQGHLSAVRVAVAPDEDLSWWEDALTERLGSSGIAFVDLSLVHTPCAYAEVLDMRFEDRFV